MNRVHVVVGVVGATLLVACLLTVYFVLAASPRSASASTHGRREAGADHAPAGGEIRSFSLKRDMPGHCRRDDQCHLGSTCKNGTCTVSPCKQCVPYTTTGLGDPKCLDYWDEESNEQRLLSKVGSSFSAPIDSNDCENVYPVFDLETPSGACSKSFSNRCEQFP